MHDSFDKILKWICTLYGLVSIVIKLFRFYRSSRNDVPTTDEERFARREKSARKG